MRLQDVAMLMSIIQDAYTELLNGDFEADLLQGNFGLDSTELSKLQDNGLRRFAQYELLCEIGACLTWSSITSKFEAAKSLPKGWAEPDKGKVQLFLKLPVEVLLAAYLFSAQDERELFLATKHFNDADVYGHQGEWPTEYECLLIEAFLLPRVYQRMLKLIAG